MTTASHRPDPAPPDFQVALTYLPPIDSPAFWQRLEQDDPTAEAISPEFLAYIIRHFYSQSQTVDAQRALTILVTRYEARALAIARWKGSLYRIDDIAHAAQDIVQEAWQRVVQTLQSGFDSLYEKRFWLKFGYVIKEQAEAYARREGYTRPANDDALAAGSDVEPVYPTNTDRIPREVQTSFTAPLGTVQDGDAFTAADILGDPHSDDHYKLIDLLDALRYEITPEEDAVLQLIMADCNLSQIATILGIDWETVRRRRDRLAQKIEEFRTLTPEQRYQRRKNTQRTMPKRKA